MELVGGDRHGVHVKLAKLNAYFADGLNGIGVNQGPGLRLPGSSTWQKIHRLNDARFVVGQHEANNRGAVRREWLGRASFVNFAVTIHRQVFQNAAASEGRGGAGGDAGMFEERDEQGGRVSLRIAGASLSANRGDREKAQDRQVVGLRSAAGENGRSASIPPDFAPSSSRIPSRASSSIRPRLAAGSMLTG